MEAKRDKITEAAETCLALSLGKDDPFKRANAYLESLKLVDGWTDAEVVEVQTLVIRALMGRISAGEGDSVAAHA